MSKLSKEEIADRRKRMQDEARKSIVKSEQLNIRIDEDSLNRLYSLSAKLGKPVGSVVREWLLERLDQEEQESSNEQLETIVEMLTSLHRKIDGLDYLLLQQQAESVGRSATNRMQSNAEQYFWGMNKAS